MSKKIFMIAVTDKEDSLNRKYTESIFELFTRASSFVKEYKIDVHYKLPVHNLRNSLKYVLTSGNYDGFIVLLDSLEGAVYNPNVMLEFGSIFYSNKPFVVISSHGKEDLPYDMQDINILDIPKEIVEYIKSCHNNPLMNVNIYNRFYEEHQVDNEKAKVQQFLENVYNQYNTSLKEHDIERNKIRNITLEDIFQEVADIKNLVSNTAEYIDGEAAAFRALKEAVDHAKFSLRTTRFANESIVKKDSIQAKADFMRSLYDISRKLKSNFYRIICNNNPAKWKDIYNILFHGENGVKVYVRKCNFSIHFELVVIDEKVAFIHFYQTDKRNMNKESENKVETLESTLKIRGTTICEKLSNIFDRLHHRNVQNGDPSRTLLGIPVCDNLEDKYKNCGSFELDSSIRPMYIDDGNERREHIINMFKDAFINWEIDDNDKINMVVGIALIEGTDRFIEEMKNNYRLNNEEFRNAKEQYEKYRNN